VALLDQQVLRVARDPPGERVGQAERGVEGLHGDHVGPADTGGEAGHRGAQHVHPRVPPRGHHRRGDRVLTLGAGRRGGAADLADPVPQPAGGAQRGDRRELVGARRVAELQRGERLVHREALSSVRGAGQCPQVGHPGGQRAAELLDGGGPGVGEDGRVDDDGAPARGRPPGDASQPGEVLLLARGGVHAQRVQAQRAARSQVGAAVDEREQRLGGR
jgi:hypothetical protein